MPDAPLVILNPAAGNGRAARLLPWIRERLESRPEVRLEVTRRPGEAEAWASGSHRVHDRVVAVGGDGTVQEVVNGLMAGADGRASIGIVPVGSGNDLARSLRLPADPAEAWTAAMGRGTTGLDVAHARGAGRERWFASAGGIGFDAQVAHAMVDRRGWQRGRAGYLLTALAQLRRFPNRRVRLTLDDGTVVERRVLMVAVTNGAFYGGGMHIAPGALVDDGLMDVCIVGDISRLDALRQLPNLYRGRHVAHPAVEMRRARTVEITGEDGTLTHLDGEPFDGLPLRVEMHRSVLTVAVPVR